MIRLIFVLFPHRLMASSSMRNSGALAPEWLFWTSLWRQKNSGAGRKTKILPIWRKNLGKYYNLKYFSVLSCSRNKLLHKNGIKMAGWVIFNFMPCRNVSNCGAFYKNCGAFWKENLGRFLALFGMKQGASWFRTIENTGPEDRVSKSGYK